MKIMLKKALGSDELGAIAVQIVRRAGEEMDKPWVEGKESLWAAYRACSVSFGTCAGKKVGCHTLSCGALYYTH